MEIDNPTIEEYEDDSQIGTSTLRLRGAEALPETKQQPDSSSNGALGSQHAKQDGGSDGLVRPCLARYCLTERPKTGFRI